MAASTDVDAFRALADGSDGSYCSDFSFLDDDAAALRAKLPKKTVKTDEQKRAAKQATDKARKDKLRQELQGLHVGGRGPRLISYLESADFTLGGELKIGRLFSSRQEASLVMMEACERLPGGGSCVASGGVHPRSQVSPLSCAPRFVVWSYICRTLHCRSNP